MRKPKSQAPAKPRALPVELLAKVQGGAIDIGGVPAGWKTEGGSI